MNEATFGNWAHKRILLIDEEGKSITITHKNGTVVKTINLSDLGGIKLKLPKGLVSGSMQFCENYEDSLAAPTLTQYDLIVEPDQVENAQRLVAWFEANRIKPKKVFDNFLDTVSTRAAIDGSNVVIWHQSFIGQIAKGGLQGEKRIPIKSILSIQFKEATLATIGYIQLETAGGSASAARGGAFEAAGDENSIIFSMEHNDEARKFKNAIQAKVDSSSQGGTNALSSADELKKFADLRDAGVISEEEFQKKKSQILGL